MDSPRTRSLASSKLDGTTWYESWLPSSRFTSSLQSHRVPTLSLFHKEHHTIFLLKLFRVHLIWLSHHLNKEYITHRHFQSNKELLPIWRVNQLPELTLHHQPDQGTGISTANNNNPPSSTSSLTITQLEQRLEEVMEKKLESMTKALRSSMSPTVEPQPATSPTIQDRDLASGLQQTQEVHLHQDSRDPTLAHRTSTGQEAQQHDIPSMLTSKAKPPIRPEETTSRRRSTRGRSRDHRESPSHSGRHRAHSYQSHREDHYIPTSRSYTPPGHRERSAPHDRSGRRDELPDWASMPTSQGERNLSRPIYQRSNAIRARPSNAESWHQIHADANTTIFARSSGDPYHRESRHHQGRQTSSITLRSRSRSRGSRGTPKSPLCISWKRSRYSSTSTSSPSPWVNKT